MRHISRETLTRWSLPILALAAGWLGGRLSSFNLADEAHAATSLDPLTRLVAEADIRQQIALYGLYVDGDGPGGRKRDLRTLADTLMTADVVSVVHPANGGAPIILNGRDVIANSRAELDPEQAKRIAGRHYLLNTVFDAITPTTAETRTTAVYFDATKNVVGPEMRRRREGACGGVPVKTFMGLRDALAQDACWLADFRNTLRDDN